MIGLETDPVVTRFCVSFSEAGFIDGALVGVDLDEEPGETDVVVTFALRREGTSRVLTADGIEYRGGEHGEGRVPVDAIAAVPFAERVVESVSESVPVEPGFCEWVEDLCGDLEDETFDFPVMLSAEVGDNPGVSGIFGPDDGEEDAGAEDPPVGSAEVGDNPGVSDVEPTDDEDDSGD